MCKISNFPACNQENSEKNLFLSINNLPFWKQIALLVQLKLENGKAPA